MNCRLLHFKFLSINLKFGSGKQLGLGKGLTIIISRLKVNISSASVFTSSKLINCIYKERYNCIYGVRYFYLTTTASTSKQFCLKLKKKIEYYYREIHQHMFPEFLSVILHFYYCYCCKNDLWRNLTINVWNKAYFQAIGGCLML